eukprot:6189791-Pleurochrysis_carterae.AAC.2
MPIAFEYQVVMRGSLRANKPECCYSSQRSAQLLTARLSIYGCLHRSQQTLRPFEDSRAARLSQLRPITAPTLKTMLCRTCLLCSIGRLLALRNNK